MVLPDTAASESLPLDDASARARLEGLGDGELVKLARGGDRAAADTLARAHRHAAYVLALQLLGNADDALDVAQDAMLRFFTTLHRFDARRPVRPWLYRIVRNRARDLFRRRKVRKHDSLDAPRGNDDDGPSFELPDPSIDPHGDAEQAQLQRRLWRALRQLTETQREILVLRDYRDLSYAEIAEVLEIPVGTVMSRLHSARKRMRVLLHDDPDTLHAVRSTLASGGGV
ncbi:MAG: sigma-70 family RNA polymerase sigma factor [Acidobacteriota bacterium]